MTASPTLPEVACPRCGDAWPRRESPLQPPDPATALQGYLRHALRDHDLDEPEALRLLQQRSQARSSPS